MKKVLIIANEYTTIVNFRMELLIELIKQYEVFVMVPYHERVKEISNLGCQIIDVNVDRTGKNPLKDYKLFRQIRKNIQIIKPSIVFTYTIKPNIYGGMACSKLNIPYVVNITGLGTAVENPGIMQKVTLFLYKRGLKKAKTVFFQNKENQDFMLNKGVVKGKYDLLPGSGVNLQKYHLEPYPSDKIIHFAYVARVMKEKGIDNYLDAATAIKNKYQNVVFHVYGKCEPEYEGLINEYQEKGLIQYHGYCNQMQPIYAMSSCIIHPTYYPEGMSNVLLESCATGRPIITTNRSGCREIVDDGINGFIVEEKNSKDLIDKIEKFLSLSDKERQQMGLNGRKKVELQFDRRIVINKYMDEILKLEDCNCDD